MRSTSWPEWRLSLIHILRSLPGLQKKPSTSELIDWIRALTFSGIPQEEILRQIPFAGVLLKKNEDLESLEKSKARRRF